YNDNVKDSRVLVMGATFKEDVADIRNSKVANVVQNLRAYNIPVDVVDPQADSDELEHEYGFGLSPEIGKDYAAVILAVSHREYRQFDDEYFKSITKPDALIADLKGIYRGRIKSRHYFCF
ncbi:MAG TPA: UDP binding domain-containing protein, partial [Chitinophagaceae bacterium]